MYDDEGNYVVLPDPETVPEYGFEGLSWEQIVLEIDAEYRFRTEQWFDENSSWFKDF